MQREDLAVALTADRGQWYLEVVAPNPKRGSGYPRQVTTGAEVTWLHSVATVSRRLTS